MTPDTAEDMGQACTDCGTAMWPTCPRECEACELPLCGDCHEADAACCVCLEGMTDG